MPSTISCQKDPYPEVWENDITLPSRFAIDYDNLLSTARVEGAANIALFLREHLPSRWRKLYVASVARPTNLVRFRCRSFDYLYDLYSELEVTGEVPYDQTAKDRVVAVLGTSAPANKPRDVGRMRDCLGDQDELLGTNRDNGHFIAHSMGGGIEANVFSQNRDLNRGWSTQGKVYRLMENYCQEHPGTFCFSRPVYSDGSSVPRWLEFGLLRNDETFWVEVFDNIEEWGRV